MINVNSFQGLKAKTYMVCLFVIMTSGYNQTGAQALQKAAHHLRNMCVADTTASRFPRSVGESGKVEYVNSGDWTSGFFPGSLWYMYEHTNDTFWLKEAKRRTVALSDQQFNRGTHDLGFMLFCSFGNGLRLTGDPTYKRILINGAASLMSRFNRKTGCIRSWDFGKWQFPVIIDNMMNLELLFWATRESGDSAYHKAAVSHASQTMKNHFREDFSSYHVVDYDTLTGLPRKKQTFQGYADSSAWARGQAWGIYGFTMVYRETQDPAFLQQAMRCADFYLGNKNLPADKIPFWDFNDPSIPNTSKDASAAAVTASALLELSRYAGKESVRYKSAARSILKSLSSDRYLAKPNTNNNFILMHSTGNRPAGSEIDKPLNYADYYFIEALLRVGARR
ncbi:MAG: glycoside hydrolase family 88 protein [Chitinophagaceae bacterium]